MANGKQMGEQNVLTFQAWLANKSDTDFRQMVIRGVLSRTEIAKECGFAKSVLDQNPKIKAALKDTEDGLRERGILPALEASRLATLGHSCARVARNEPCLTVSASNVSKRKTLAYTHRTASSSTNSHDTWSSKQRSRCQEEFHVERTDHPSGLHHS